MSNLYQKKGSTYIYTEIWDASSGTIRAKLNTDYTFTHITAYPTSSDPLEVLFSPTRSNGYQLKFNFINTVKIDVTHLMQNGEIEMLYITAPSVITFLDNHFAMSGSVSLPPSNDQDSNYYKLYTAWGTQSSSEEYYRKVYSSNRDKTQLSPSTPTLAGQQGIFGSILKSYGTTLVFLVDLNGRTLYSSKRDGD